MKTLFAVVLSAAVISSCGYLGIHVVRGNGVAVETVIDVDGFSHVSLPAAVDVDYTLSSGERSLVFTCDENLLEYYNIHVEGNTLVVGVRPGVMGLSPKVKTVLTVKAPVLEGVIVSGSGDCVVHGPVAVDGAFSLMCSGSGDISVSGPVRSAAFTAATTGSGDISVGTVDAVSSAELRSSGSGDISIGSLVADPAEIHTSGSGDITVKGITAGTITAHSSGSGDIGLKCVDAGIVHASTSGSGDIRVSGTARGINSKSTGSGDVYSGDLMQDILALRITRI